MTSDYKIHGNKITYNKIEETKNIEKIYNELSTFCTNQVEMSNKCNYNFKDMGQKLNWPTESTGLRLSKDQKDT